MCTLDKIEYDNYWCTELQRLDRDHNGVILISSMRIWFWCSKGGRDDMAMDTRWIMFCHLIEKLTKVEIVRKYLLFLDEDL